MRGRYAEGVVVLSTAVTDTSVCTSAPRSAYFSINQLTSSGRRGAASGRHAAGLSPRPRLWLRCARIRQQCSCLPWRFHTIDAKCKTPTCDCVRQVLSRMTAGWMMSLKRRGSALTAAAGNVRHGVCCVCCAYARGGASDSQPRIRVQRPASASFDGFTMPTTSESGRHTAVLGCLMLNSGLR